MKKLTEYINERFIFELSDELIQRAIDKSLKQNTVLTRRRAKEFEKWLNDPKRKELQELAANSNGNMLKKLLDAKSQYFDAAIEFINKGKKKEAAKNLEQFFAEWSKILMKDTTKFGKISIRRHPNNMRYTGIYKDNYYTEHNENMQFDNFSRKHDKRIYDYPRAFRIQCILDDEKDTLENHDYRKRIDIIIIFDCDKTGKFSTYMDIPFYAFPSSYKSDVESMISYFNNLGIMNKNPISCLIGKESLNDELNIKTIIANKFSAHIDDDSIETVLNKLVQALKEIDPKCSVSFVRRKSKLTPSGAYYGSSQMLNNIKDTDAILTFCNKKHKLSIHEKSGYWETGASIQVDEIEKAIYASKELYDAGCWIGGNFKCKDEFFELLNKDID